MERIEKTQAERFDLNSEKETHKTEKVIIILGALALFLLTFLVTSSWYQVAVGAVVLVVLTAAVWPWKYRPMG